MTKQMKTDFHACPEHREVSYYTDCLCVTSKYLLEVLKKVSGYAANYWINRYTILDISRLLRNKPLTFVQISDMFGFSSPAYLSRYAQLIEKKLIIGDWAVNLLPK